MPAEDSGGYYVEVTPDGEGPVRHRYVPEISHLFWNQRYPMSLLCKSRPPNAGGNGGAADYKCKFGLGFFTGQQR